MKKLLSIILVLALTMGLSAPVLAANNDFTVENGVLTRYNGAGGNVTIPSSVTEIGVRAFYGCENLSTVIIPSSVKTIGNFAFNSCETLTGVTIPDSVTSIGTAAFSNCTGLTSVTIPDSVTSIGESAFSSCSGLGSISIPSSVTSFGRLAFSNCTGLTSAAIACPVIGEGAFSGCKKLTGVVLDGVTTIGVNAFRGCSGLGSITIPDSVTSLGSNAFSSCTGLTAVTVPDSITSFGQSVFDFCESLTDVTLADGLTSIGYSAFSNCTGLTEITIPDSVTSIGEYAFENCKNISEIIIPGGVTSIEMRAFRGCTGLTEITLPDGVSYVGKYAFQSCTGLTGVFIPDSVTNIDVGAFYQCSSLSDVYYSGSEKQWSAVSVNTEGDKLWTAVDPDEPLNAPLLQATVHFNSAAPVIPDAPVTPADTTAYASTQTVSVDGKSVTLEAYALKDENGYPTNYVKLRDIAYLLNGTAAQFEVGWDGNVNIVTDSPYTPNGSEMSTPFSSDRSYTIPTAQTNINGAAADLAAISLTDDNGGGYTYYQLRDLGRALGFNVGWSGECGIFIETDKPYTDAN